MDNFGEFVGSDDEYDEGDEGDEKLRGLARGTDPNTSHEAANKIDTSKLCGMIYGIIAKYGEGGCIGEQVIQALPHLRPQSISPRFSQMIALGMLEDTLQRKLASSGYLQIVRRVKLPPFISQHKRYFSPGIALALLREFPENGNTEVWNSERKQFLGIL